MNYVAHDCRNTRLPESHSDFCNNRWVDKDLSRVNSMIPTWKYCRDCCQRLGINFDSQVPSDYTSKAQKETQVKMRLKLKSKTDSNTL